MYELFTIVIIILILLNNILVDKLIHFLCGFIKLKYKDIKTGKYITYHFDHSYYDGALIAKTIYHCKEIPNELGKVSYKRSYIFKNTKSNYSNFVMSCAKICNTLLAMQPRKDKITIAIVISIRNHNDHSYGNKFKYVSVTVYKHDRLLTTACRIRSIIKRAKSKSYMNDRPGLTDVFKLIQCDHVINSWNELINITRSDGTKLELCNIHNINIFDRMIKEKCSLIIGTDNIGTFPILCENIYRKIYQP